jgi:hypothetical protein
MQHTINLNPGDTLVVNVLGAPGVAINAGRRGPKALPPSTISSDQLQADILKIVKKKPMTGAEIRAKVQEKHPGASTNAVSWALVDLQYEGRRRNRKPPQGGPLVKNTDGTYSRAA